MEMIECVVCSNFAHQLLCSTFDVLAWICHNCDGDDDNEDGDGERWRRVMRKRWRMMIMSMMGGDEIFVVCGNEEEREMIECLVCRNFTHRLLCSIFYFGAVGWICHSCYWGDGGDFDKYDGDGEEVEKADEEEVEDDDYENDEGDEICVVCGNEEEREMIECLVCRNFAHRLLCSIFDFDELGWIFHSCYWGDGGDFDEYDGNGEEVEEADEEEGDDDDYDVVDDFYEMGYDDDYDVEIDFDDYDVVEEIEDLKVEDDGIGGGKEEDLKEADDDEDKGRVKKLMKL